MIPVYDKVIESPDGTPLYYRVHLPSEERPPTILLIHGLGSNRTRWKRLAETKFFKKCRLIIPELRGHGSSVTRNRIGVDPIAANLEAILKQEGENRPVVVGHCLGANIAVRQAFIKRKG